MASSPLLVPTALPRARWNAASSRSKSLHLVAACVAPRRQHAFHGAAYGGKKRFVDASEMLRNGYFILFSVIYQRVFACKFQESSVVAHVVRIRRTVQDASTRQTAPDEKIIYCTPDAGVDIQGAVGRLSVIVLRLAPSSTVTSKLPLIATISWRRANANARRGRCRQGTS